MHTPVRLAGALVTASMLVGLGTAAALELGERPRPLPHAFPTPSRARPRRRSPTSPGPSRPVRRSVLLGRSVQGRPIRAVELGDPASPHRILVVGCIHGNEPAGIAVARSLQAGPLPRGLDVWVIPDLNPDGVAAGTRLNAHGVDLNRNFPFRWQPIGGLGNEFYSGPSALSEPESTLAAGLIRRIHPEISVWFHQQDAVVDESGGAVGIERRYAGLVGLPLRRLTRFPGSATGWENHLRPGSTAFVVELPAGSLTPAASGIYAGAILRLLPGSGAAGPHPFPRPPIVWKPVPFGPARRSETAAYAERHYGIRTWRLVEPRVIVEHFTGGTSFGSAWNTFAANGPDLGELPGTCAHFIVDTDGTIFQLAPLSVMCRHTVGLNWTAIGIEDVATSDAQVLHDRRQLAASLRLTLWLMQRFHVAIRNVIGHNESLSSPFHFELYAAWRCQTHSDWTPGDMRTYRLLLAGLAARHGVSVGSRSRVAPTTC